MFDAAEVLAEYPQFGQSPEMVAELAYEEFWRRQQAGEDIDQEAFLARFPAAGEPLRRAIEVDALIKEDPDLFFAITKPAWPSVGSRIGEFVLERQIGSGSFSRVYLAHDQALGCRRVVVKVTTHSVRESEALGRLRHPRIMSPLGLYHDLLPGLAVISMPWSGTATLLDVLQARPASSAEWKGFRLENVIATRLATDGFADSGGSVDWPEGYCEAVIQTAAQLADAIAYAHEQGIYHCDIKPSNILIGADGSPTLLDFNLSAAVVGNASFAGGTPAYLPPELLDRRDRETPVTGGADVYSLAATFIELLQGRPPFDVLNAPSSSDNGSFRHPLNQGAAAFQFSAPLRKQLGRPLANLLETCVAAEVRQRPTSRRLANELQGFIARTVQLRPRRRVAQRTVLAIMVTALLAGAASWGYRQELSEAERFQRGREAVMSPEGHAGAIKHLTALLATHPERSDARGLRALASLQQGDWQSAYSDLRDVTAEHPLPELHNLTGYALCRWRRQYEMAEIELRKAHNAGLKSLDLLNNLAFCWDRLGALEDARRLFEEARALDPNCGTVIYNQARLHLRLAFVQRFKPDVRFARDILSHPELSVRSEPLLTAAWIFSEAANGGSDSCDTALECLRRSALQGLSKSNLEAIGRDYPSLVADKRFEQLRKMTLPKALDRPQQEAILPPPIDQPAFIENLVDGLQANATVATR
ncbi:protein kinase domain-containing protein [Planctomicrobium piriforme]|uniref:serine/threonine-protein kinase n=1 Tax=Planctomicrobium piriforme TaxID=1576369 RepID=UPI001C31BE6B|nr:serine/threonine-protein kinase [Planctomicrobium piriforme]